MRKQITKFTSILCVLFTLLLPLTSCQTSQSDNQKLKESQEATMKPTPTPTTSTIPSEAPTQEPTIAPVSTIKNTEPFTLTFMGHASVKLKSKAGKIIYIDPNSGTGNFSEPADFVLVTHAHDDHKPLDTVARKTECIQITTAEGIKNGVYQTFDYGDIQIEAVPAGGNENHVIGNGVGYIVTIDGVTIYHAGDTSMIEEMKQLTARKLDYAMFPIDGMYNMAATEATEVANLVGAKHNIPIHDMNDSNQHKEDNFTPEGRLILALDETISLSGK